MRIRALKPGFFKNEQLAELSAWHRLCFEGLWCCADKQGRLQDRPKRLKVEIFPYDDLNMDQLLWDLSRAGFIVRYVAQSHPLIWIPSWDAHQHPRPDEAESTLAEFAPGSERTGSEDTRLVRSARGEPPPPPTLTARDTDPSLHSDEPTTPARMGHGTLDVGSGTWDLGHGARAAETALTPRHAQALIDLWNVTTQPPLPRCRELTDERRRKIRARLAKRPDLAEWREAFEALLAIPFYRGENDRGWVADFDYVIRNDTVVAKVLERVRAGVVAPKPTNKRVSGLVAGGEAFLRRTHG